MYVKIPSRVSDTWLLTKCKLLFNWLVVFHYLLNWLVVFHYFTSLRSTTLMKNDRSNEKVFVKREILEGRGTA